MMRKFWFLSVLVLSLFSCSPNPHVVIQTRIGEIEIELYRDTAPGHVENFIKLVDQRFYVGTTFHRVIPGNLIQGGDPLSKDTERGNDGTGGPGYTIESEMKMLHKRGSVASARLPDQVNPRKRSNGSQFYICLKDFPALDKGGYTVFGQVIRGMEVVDKIAMVAADNADNPIYPVVMEQVYRK
jgi:peptidyl-prolyl cis-trans isomerase B (cyclophilin B)